MITMAATTMTETATSARRSNRRAERSPGGPPRRPKRKKRHAAAVSRVAATGTAATVTAVLVAVMGAGGRDPAGPVHGRASGWVDDTGQLLLAPVDGDGTVTAVEPVPPAPVTDVARLSPPVTRSTES